MPRSANGGFAEHAVCPAASTFEMPDEIPLPDAAALYLPFHLAWLGLFDRAGLEAGDSVLVHAAAGGSGSAAVQLAVHAGARVFATAAVVRTLCCRLRLISCEKQYRCRRAIALAAPARPVRP